MSRTIQEIVFESRDASDKPSIEEMKGLFTPPTENEVREWRAAAEELIESIPQRVRPIEAVYVLATALVRVAKAVGAEAGMTRVDSLGRILVPSLFTEDSDVARAVLRLGASEVASITVAAQLRELLGGTAFDQIIGRAEA